MNRREEEQLIRLTKWMILLMGVLIILTLFSCESGAKAAVITGDKPIAGASYWINKYIEVCGHSPFTEDIELLAEVMFHENYVNGEEVMYYTGAVVMNRVKSKHYPDTIKGVLYQNHPRQYGTTDEFFTKTVPQEVYTLAVKILKYGTSDVPDNVVYQAMFRQGSGVWKRIPSVYAPTKDIEYFCYE